MKNDLVTSIVVGVLGVVIAYFVCNMFLGEIKPVTIKTIDSSMGIDIAEPDPELFNYKAVNPTVEVYVGNDDNCKQYDQNGQCVYEDDDNVSNPQSDQGNN
jgi:hypothetical protein